MKRIFSVTAIAAILGSLVLTTGCDRIPTGSVGVRIGYDKQVQQGELVPGSFNQTIVGDVLTFPVRNVSVSVENMTPVAKDNSTMKDFDVMVVYNINPAQVSELYSTMNHSFHTENAGDVYLMYNYIFNATRNAVYKSARKYDALDMNDAREAMEQEVRALVTDTIADEKLSTAITIQQVLIRNVVPADVVVNSANELVRAKNELKQKEVEVRTAQKEAERIAALNANPGAIQYMDAQTRRIQAESQLEAAKKGSLMIVAPGTTPMVGIK